MGGGETVKIPTLDTSLSDLHRSTGIKDEHNDSAVKGKKTNL